MRRTAFTALLLLAVALVGQPFADAGGKKRLSKDEALVELGRRLFFDPAVSRSGKNSCASCHDPDHGFSDPARLSVDDLGLTRRHSQPLIDLHLNPSSHWDGEFTNVLDLTTARLRPFRGKRGKHLSGHGIAGSVTGGENDPGRRERPRDDDPYGDGDSAAAPAEADAPDAGGSETDGRPEDSPSYREENENDADDREYPSDCRACGNGGAPAERPHDAREQSEKIKKDTEAEAAKESSEDKNSAPAVKDEPRWAETESDPGPSREEEIRERFDPTKLPRVADVLSRAGRYDELFKAAFGNTRVTTRKLGQAIQAYSLTIRSTEAPIDRYLAGKTDALSASAKRGLALFRGKARCSECHTMEGKRPTFTDYKFHNTGVSMHDMVARDGKSAARHEVRPDEGRAERSKRPSEVRAFKTPTLRDLTRRGPFMHSGRFDTLEEVIRYYVDGGGPDPDRSAHVHGGFKATDAEVADLVAFLESLTGDVRPGLAAEPLPLRARSTRLRFVDARGRALAGLSVRLVPEGDVLPAEKAEARVRTLTTDRRGWIEFTPGARTHLRVALPQGLPIQGGALVPDSCRKAVLRVPVAGRTAIVVSSDAATQAPSTLVAEHVWGNVIPGHAIPRTVFQKARDVTAGRSRITRYEAWLRTDVPARVVLRVPGDAAGKHAPELELRVDGEARVRLP